MNMEIANSLSGYIETLYNLNQKLVKLCGTNVSYKYEYSYKEILDIIQDIPRLIPYSYNNDKKILEYCDKDGLLEYQDEIEYLTEMYDSILASNYDFLDKVRIIRNKYEHKMHFIKRRSAFSGKYLFFEFCFIIGNNIVIVGADEVISLVKQLNSLFSKIINEIKTFAKENDRIEIPYYQRILRFDFEEFNSIYNSDLLWIFGKLMIDF